MCMYIWTYIRVDRNIYIYTHVCIYIADRPQLVYIHDVDISLLVLNVSHKIAMYTYICIHTYMDILLDTQFATQNRYKCVHTYVVHMYTYICGRSTRYSICHTKSLHMYTYICGTHVYIHIWTFYSILNLPHKIATYVYIHMWYICIHTYVDVLLDTQFAAQNRSVFWYYRVSKDDCSAVVSGILLRGGRGGGGGKAFSKVSLLLNLPYTITTEQNFEKSYWFVLYGAQRVDSAVYIVCNCVVCPESESS